jgi:spermidine/putrescine transport system substrate-binding protein
MQPDQQTTDADARTVALISRRRLLQTMAAVGAGAFVAACGTAGAGGATKAPATAGTPTTAPTGGQSSAPTAAASSAPESQGPVTGTFHMATWIGYIDVSDDNKTHPSLDRFTAETGIIVDYQESVDANESFYASQLQGPLSQGVPTGWDIVVLTDWLIQRLKDKDWLEEITPGTTFPANLQDIYTTREWDPGNKFAAPWQSGMTGIGYDKAKSGELTDLGVFFDKKYEGKITYQTEMNDCVGLTALYQGNDPTTLTQAQFDQAIAAITKAVNDGLVRQMTGNSYVNDLQVGDAQVSQAWSGDVLTLLVPKQKKDQDFTWTLADQGGMLWTDNMSIPKGAQNIPQARVFIDWYYEPANAAEIEAYVNYVCPVKGADKEIVKIDPELGTNTLIFPTPEMFAKLHQFIATDPATRSSWEEAFAKAVGL